MQNTYSYDPYGTLTASTGSVYNPFGYAGEYTDGESGFLYLRARYYDPATQQFLTVDPWLAVTGQAYNYTGGSPLNGTDPAGLKVEGFCVGYNRSFFFLNGSGIACLVFSTSGEIGLQFSPGGGAGTQPAGGGILLGRESSDWAQNLKDMEGPFVGLGGSVGEVPVIEPLGVEGDVAVGTTSDNRIIDQESCFITFGQSVFPIEIHAGVAPTYPVGSYINIPQMIGTLFGNILAHIIHVNPRAWKFYTGLGPPFQP